MATTNSKAAAPGKFGNSSTGILWATWWMNWSPGARISTACMNWFFFFMPGLWRVGVDIGWGWVENIMARMGKLAYPIWGFASNEHDTNQDPNQSSAGPDALGSGGGGEVGVQPRRSVISGQGSGGIDGAEQGTTP